MDPVAAAGIIAFISGIIGGMVGGSYLLFIPALLFLGFDIYYILGITKITSLSINLSFVNFLRHKKVDLKLSWPFAIVVFFGSIIGSFIVIQISEDILQTTIAILMIVIAAFLLLKKDFGMKLGKKKIGKKAIILGLAYFFVIGIYIGFYAAASTVFSIIVFIALFRKDLVEAIGSLRFIELFAALGGFLVFAWGGYIDYKVAIPIGVVYLGGSWLGSHITIKKGAEWVKYLLIALSIVFAIKLLFLR